MHIVMTSPEQKQEESMPSKSFQKYGDQETNRPTIERTASRASSRNSKQEVLRPISGHLTQCLLEMVTSGELQQENCTCPQYDTSHVTEWDLLGSWCSCEHSDILRDLAAKRNYKRREKTIIAGKLNQGAIQNNLNNSNNSTSFGTGIEKFQHHDDITKYMAEYRMFHCLQYQEPRGQWISIAELANKHYNLSRERENTVIRPPEHVSVNRSVTNLSKAVKTNSSSTSHHNSQSSQQVKVVDNVWNPELVRPEEVQHRRKHGRKKEKSSTDLKRLTEKYSIQYLKERAVTDLPASKSDAGFGAPKTKEQDDYKFFTRPFHVQGIQNDVKDVNLPELDKKERQEEKKKARRSDKVEKTEFPNVGHGCRHLTSPSEDKEARTQDISSKTESLSPKTTQKSSGYDGKLSQKPQLACIYTGEDCLLDLPNHQSTVSRLILPKLQRWISEMRMYDSETENDNIVKVPHRKDDILHDFSKLSTTSLPDLPFRHRVLDGQHEKVAIYSSRGRTVRAPEKKTNNKGNSESHAKKVHVVSDDVGNVTRVLVSHGQDASRTGGQTTGDDMTNVASSQSKVRKLGTSRSGAWETCKFRS